MVDVRLSMIENSLQEDTESSEISFIEQYVQDVLDFSSQYGSDISISYTAYNITGKPSKFPDYGDFPQAFVMRTYGNWWNEAPSRREDFMVQNYGKIISHDFIDVTFDEPVYPFRVSVYETYNPGSVVRIWAAGDGGESGGGRGGGRGGCRIRWVMLWEGEARVVGHKPHIFSPPIATIDFPTRMLRLEFDHSKLDYYTEIDALLLVGTKKPIPPASEMEQKVDKETGDITKKIMDLNIHSIPPQVDLENTLNQFLAEDYRQLLRELEDTAAVLTGAVESVNKANSGPFGCLPDETSLHVFSYLDLPSLCQCAKVNRHFHTLATDSLLYTQVNLRPYWHCVTDDTLDVLSLRCQHLTKLDLSWCGSYDLISSTNVVQFIKTSGKQLTHLRLDCCRFVDDAIIKTIASTCRNIKELTLRNCSRITSEGFNSLASVSSLERLDLYRTQVEMQPLIKILKASPMLKHINLGSCVRVSSMDEVAQALGTYNQRLVTVDFWKTYSLTPVGVRAISRCSMLEEVDFGWCLGVSVPGDWLTALAVGCPRLQKLFMTALRGIMDRELEPSITHLIVIVNVYSLGVSVPGDCLTALAVGCPRLQKLFMAALRGIMDRDLEPSITHLIVIVNVYSLGVSVPGDCLTALAVGCPRLQKLFMAALRGIMDRDLEPSITHLIVIVNVYSLGVSVPGDCLTALAVGCPRLQKLFMAALRGIMDRDLEPSITHLIVIVNVYSLGVSVPGDCLTALAVGCPRLQKLFMAALRDIMDRDLEPSITHLIVIVNVYSLGVSLPGDCLTALAVGCPRLQKLFMAALRGIMDRDLEPSITHLIVIVNVYSLGVSVPGDCLTALAVGCPRLQKLFMAALRGIMDRDLEPFLTHCRQLRQVDLLGVRSITADICLRFLCMFPQLQLLDLSFCDQIQESLIVQWREQFPHVSIKRSFQSEGAAGCYLPNHY